MPSAIKSNDKFLYSNESILIIYRVRERAKKKPFKIKHTAKPAVCTSAFSMEAPKTKCHS